MPNFEIPNFENAFPGTHSLLLWLACIAVAICVISTMNTLTLRRPFFARSFVASVLAYFVAAPCLFTLRDFIPTISSIALHVAAYTLSATLLWFVLFRPAQMPQHMPTAPDRYLW